LTCKHFGECGSCSLYEQGYAEQVREKKERVGQLLAPFYGGDLECFVSPESHYRARAEFRIWHEGDRCSYAMGRLEGRGAVTIEECPKVSTPIAKRMWALLGEINRSSQLAGRLFAVEFLATTTDECLITLLYHRKLDAYWEAEATALQEKLDCRIIGRSRKQKVVLSEEYVLEKLTIGGEEFFYRQYESGFTQPNPAVNVQMIEWAIGQVRTIERRDLLESYCGLGNFTVPLSRHFDKVLATEVSKRSIRAAQENCRLNAVESIEFVRLSSEEMTQALSGVRRFRRLEHIDLSTYDFSCVLVDPPRAGLDDATIALISKIDAILYISCNPETLVRDLGVLTRTHRVRSAAIFDQFPHTTHIESGVLLERNREG
jgi:tRNA (uracil-5-)-methyltransferase